MKKRTGDLYIYSHSEYIINLMSPLTFVSRIMAKCTAYKLVSADVVDILLTMANVGYVGRLQLFY